MYTFIYIYVCVCVYCIYLTRLGKRSTKPQGLDALRDLGWPPEGGGVTYGVTDTSGNAKTARGAV